MQNTFWTNWIMQRYMLLNGFVILFWISLVYSVTKFYKSFAQITTPKALKVENIFSFESCWSFKFPPILPARWNSFHSWYIVCTKLLIYRDSVLNKHSKCCIKMGLWKLIYGGFSMQQGHSWHWDFFKLDFLYTLTKINVIPSAVVPLVLL